MSESNTTQLIQADTLIHARWILPVDSQNSVLENHCLVISSGLILDICPSSQVGQSYQGHQEFQLDKHVLIPGLINAHCHSAMSLFRGYADDLSLQPWLEGKIWPAENRWVNESFVKDGAEIAIAEMLSAGVTTFSDMYFFPDQVASAAQQAHMRVQVACPILDFPTVWAQNADEYINKATSLNDEMRGASLVTTAFGPHAPYTVSNKPLEKIAILSDELELPIQIHLHENITEINKSLTHYGISPLQRLHDLGLLSPQLQAVHMTELTEEEIELLAENQVNIVHCPSSNLKLASGITPIAALQKAGINTCLGTDGAASNNSLDILSEMHIAALVAKQKANDAKVVDASTALKMATINAATALGLDKQIGSLHKGKCADITAINLDHINSLPVYNPFSSLAYSVKSSQVSHVWVNGNLNLQDGKLLTIDLEACKHKAQSWAERIS